MSRQRKHLYNIDTLTSNDYLEPSEQDVLIELLNNASLAENEKYLKIFLTIFLIITPFYTVLPFFKQNPIFGFWGLVIIILNCVNLRYLNYYDLAKKQLLQRELFTDSASSSSKTSLPTDRRGAVRSANSIEQFKASLFLAFESFREKTAGDEQNVYYFLFNAAHLGLSVLYVYAYRYKVDNFAKHKYSLETLVFIAMPLFASMTSIVVNHWISSIAREIDGLKKLKYHEKSV